MGVEMTAKEVDRFLAEHHTVTFITIGRGGMPVPAPLWYASKGPVIYAGTRSNTVKVDHLRRDPRAVAQVEAGLGYLELRGVVIWGHVEFVTGADELAWLAEEMAQKYAGFRPDPAALPAGTQRQSASAPRATFKLIPERMKTWDFSKLRLPGGGG